MKLLLLLASISAVVTLALPATALADGIVATCTTPSGTGSCSADWYRSDVTVSFTLPGGSSNPQGCGNQTVATDTPQSGLTITCTVAVSGTQCCRLDVTIKRDATPPTATGIALQRGPDANGWYNHPVGVTVSGDDGTTDTGSGIASCTSVTYSGPDSSSVTVGGTCTDNAGNVSAERTTTFPYDATPPSVTAAPARAPDANGWYNHAVGVAFQGTDAVSGIDGCTSASYSGPDSATASLAGSCRDKAGNVQNVSLPLKYDATPPTVTSASPDRPPDHNGFYNHKLVVKFAGADATSGIAACDAPAYTKPDSEKASVTGRCRDNAGNLSAPGAYGFKFDSTPPKLAKLTVATLDGGAALKWTASADTAEVKVVRKLSGKKSMLYVGKRIDAFTDRKARNGKHYTYLITAVDAAGNVALGKAKVVPAATLIAPRRAQKVHGVVKLRWRPVKKAAYYNVQLWHAGKKLLTTWPKRPHLKLPRLKRGAYAWFVWPGFGPRAKHRYGKLIGKSTFVVVKG